MLTAKEYERFNHLITKHVEWLQTDAPPEIRELIRFYERDYTAIRDIAEEAISMLELQQDKVKRLKRMRSAIG